jgi:hypothetical protein
MTQLLLQVEGTIKSSPSSFPSATNASNRFNSARSFNTPRCRRLTNPSGASNFGLDRPFGARFACLSLIEMTFGQCAAALRKKGF